jgi:phosphoglucomutase/UDP-N-acetylglucosamine pyrophosphorylase
MQDSPDEQLQAFLIKMREDGVTDNAFAFFVYVFDYMRSGQTGLVLESEIEPLLCILSLENDVIPLVGVDFELLNQVVVTKLNGGLGTSMGLDQAKSLLPVKGDKTFLDLIALQILKLEEKYDKKVTFLLMNSFNTSEDTMSFLQSRYPTLEAREFLQNRIPKIEKETLNPAQYEPNPSQEWCPPGHGDIFTSLYGSGLLEQLVKEEGKKYMFISNSDNLGAVLDLEILTFMRNTQVPYLMEVCGRLENDKKGGHLCVRKETGALMLRETAMCHPDDVSHFQDTTLHPYFNTNNLWVNLPALLALMEAQNGILRLPVILNKKTVNPTDGNSTPVIQLETAMGSAIECFSSSNNESKEGEGLSSFDFTSSQALLVPRHRFQPVKKCHDLFVLRSDAFELDPSTFQLTLAAESHPIVSLDSNYTFVYQLDEHCRYGLPSLRACSKLTVNGPFYFTSNLVMQGQVSLTNDSSDNQTIFIPKEVLPEGSERGQGSTLLLGDGTCLNLSATEVEAKTDDDDDHHILTVPSHTPFQVNIVKTTPFPDQKMGTSGLRKKTTVFMQENFVENFVQAIFNVLKANVFNDYESTCAWASRPLLIGGDGRFFNDAMIDTVIKIGVANGLNHFIVPKHGFLSTPAASAIIREYSPSYNRPLGAFILTASHNPSGLEHGDVGIKFNMEDGSPMPSNLSNLVAIETKRLGYYSICPSLPSYKVMFPEDDREDTTKDDLQKQDNRYVIESEDDRRHVVVTSISPSKLYLDFLSSIFDFQAIGKLLSYDEQTFKLLFDGMNGITGYYATRLFGDYFGLNTTDCLQQCVPLEDFGGIHADPNLKYAHILCEKLGLTSSSSSTQEEKEEESNNSNNNSVFHMGAASDGDGDRNMILGHGFFVTPSDSLAILLAYADAIPYFQRFRNRMPSQ